MMTKRINQTMGAALLLVGASLSGVAWASTWTWDFTGGDILAANDTQGVVTATASAVSSSSNITALAGAGASLKYNGSSGLSVIGGGESASTTSPNHATDNEGYLEAILFNFSGAKVNLDVANFGWVGRQNTNSPYDSDYSVYAFMGNEALFTTALSYKAMQSADISVNKGWKLVGHYSGGTTVNTPGNPTGGNRSITGSDYSSHWLIGAYNGLGSGVDGSGSVIDSTKDYFKLRTLTGSTFERQVPEPGTLLLMGAGLLGLTRLNTRRMVRSAA